jgi:hypothetical protein
VISISKTIDWKISLDENFLDGNVNQTRNFPIINQRDDRKICDLKLQIANREDSGFQFVIESSPVSVDIFFAASVDFLNAAAIDKLNIAKFDWTEYQKSQEIRLSKSVIASSKLLVLNVRCKVTSK